MKKKIILSILTLFIAVVPVYGETRIPVSDYGTLSRAVKMIPENAGDTVIVLDLSRTEESTDWLFIPAERGITSLRLETPLERAAVSGLSGLFANGIPFTLAENVTMEDTALYGGSYAVAGESRQTERTDLRIAGTVGYIYGGGLAEDGGHSLTEESHVTVLPGGLVLFQVFGGAYAAGAGSTAEVAAAYTEIMGTVDYALAGGYAEDGGESAVTAGNLTVTSEGKVGVALFSGGSAADVGSVSRVINGEAHLYGEAPWAFAGDLALEGGSARTEQVARLVVEPGGHAGSAYCGGYSASTGSSVYAELSELHTSQNADQVYDRGQAVDGATEQSFRTAHFQHE